MLNEYNSLLSQFSETIFLKQDLPKLLIDPSRRDDIESLIYVILYLFIGELPWHEGAQKLKGKQRLEYVIKMKMSLDICDYGMHVPGNITRYNLFNRVYSARLFPHT